MNQSRRGFLHTLAGTALVPVAPRLAWAATGGKSLFNGKSLAAWDTWLGVPHKTVVDLDHPRNEQGEYAGVIGLNKDPKQVFSVVALDGEPAIRISGEIFGALTSKESFGDFHLSLQYKWGEKKWAPKDKAARDSGLLYYCVGEHGADGRGKFWMRSLECQIQEHDTGDFWSLVGVTVDVEGDRPASAAGGGPGGGATAAAIKPPAPPSPAGSAAAASAPPPAGGAAPAAARPPANPPVTYRKGGTRFVVPGPDTPRRIFKSADYEKENDWNQVEILCLRGTCVHVVNGKINLVVSNPRVPVETPGAAPAGSGGAPAPTAFKPLRRGQLQIQSEGAEVFYRRLTVRPLKAFPAAYRP
jgi:hypothetical protein